MQGEMECEGQISFGPLPWEISERLAQYRGHWLEFSTQENAMLARKALPEGCPAPTAVSCELIHLIESLPPEIREAMPGGEVFIRSRTGRIMRFAVSRGEIRIQWPTEDYSRPITVSPDIALSSLDASEARIKGWARLSGSRTTELQALVDHFGGIYPERDLPSECEQNVAFVPFKGARVDPQELVARLQALADPIESLQAELEVTSIAPKSEDRDFRIRIRNGQVEASRPSLWT